MWLQLIIAAALAAAAASSSWWLTKDHYEGVIAEAKVEADKAVKVADDRATKIDADWQTWSAQQHDRIVYRDRKAAVIFAAAPAWSAASVPDAVRVLLASPAPNATDDTGGVDGAVPAAGAASAPAQPGSGAGLSGVKGFFGRLFSSSPGSGASNPVK